MLVFQNSPHPLFWNCSSSELICCGCRVIRVENVVVLRLSQSVIAILIRIPGGREEGRKGGGSFSVEQ